MPYESTQHDQVVKQALSCKQWRSGNRTYRDFQVCEAAQACCGLHWLLRIQPPACLQSFNHPYNHPHIVSCMYPFIHPHNHPHAFVRTFIHACSKLSDYSFDCSLLICTFVCLFVCSLLYLLIHSFIHSFISLTHPYIHLCILHSLPYTHHNSLLTIRYIPH